MAYKPKPPNNQEGKNGDIVIALDKGVNKLYGKANGQWLSFGNGKKIGYRGRVDLSESISDDYIDNLNVANKLHLRRLKEISTDTDQFLMSDNGTIKYVTGANLATYIGLGGSYLLDTTDTFTGTLTVDMNSSASTTTSNYGQKIDLDFSGNPGLSQVVTNYGLDIDFDFTGANATGGTTNSFGINIAMNTEAGSHSGASGIDNTAIKAVLTGDTDTSDTTQIGYDLTITGGDVGSQTGLLINTDDGSTDLKIVSSADTGDYFSIATTTHGATTFTTVDDDATAAHLTLDADGNIELDSANDRFNFNVNGDTLFHLRSSQSVVYYAGTDSLFRSEVTSNRGATTLATVDSSSSDSGHLTIDPAGEINLTPVTEVKSDAPLKIREAAGAVQDTDTYGQIWVKNEDPEELYFTTGGGDDIQITNGTELKTSHNPHVFEFGGLARTQYNNWYYGASTSYGHNYYYFFSTTGSTSTPSAWVDSFPPSFLVPRAGTITGWTVIGNLRSTDTWEWMCMKGDPPTFGSAGNWSLSQIGATQSAGGTANILYKWETTGVSVSVDKNDMLAFFFRRTTDNDTTYAYCEFSAYITME